MEATVWLGNTSTVQDVHLNQFEKSSFIDRDTESSDPLAHSLGLVSGADAYVDQKH